MNRLDNIERNNNLVALIRTTDSKEAINGSIKELLKIIDFKSPTIVKSIDIKVNLAYYWDAYTGYTTDPRIISSLIDIFREYYGDDIKIRIVEADATAMRTKHAFRMLGYDILAKEKDVELFNLSLDKLESKEVEVNGRTITYEVPESLLNTDLLVNVPKLKIMAPTKITCALKNIFGCIATPRKIMYHSYLNEAIVGINKILHPQLTVVDGIVSLGQHPVKLNLLLASKDPFSIDWVASQIMGYNPAKIGFLKIAIKEKLGTPKKIVTIGETIQPFQKLFPRENHNLSTISAKTRKAIFRLYTKVSNDVVFPSLEGV